MLGVQRLSVIGIHIPTLHFVLLAVLFCAPTCVLLGMRLVTLVSGDGLIMTRSCHSFVSFIFILRNTLGRAVRPVDITRWNYVRSSIETPSWDMCARAPVSALHITRWVTTLMCSSQRVRKRTYRTMADLLSTRVRPF